MNLTTNDLLIVIGEQTLTIKAQQITIQALEEKLKEQLASLPQQKPPPAA